MPRLYKVPFLCQRCDDPLDSDRVKPAGSFYVHQCAACGYRMLLDEKDFKELQEFVQIGRQRELELAQEALEGEK